MNDCYFCGKADESVKSVEIQANELFICEECALLFVDKLSKIFEGIFPSLSPIKIKSNLSDVEREKFIKDWIKAERFRHNVFIEVDPGSITGSLSAQGTFKRLDELDREIIERSSIPAIGSTPSEESRLTTTECWRNLYSGTSFVANIVANEMHDTFIISYNHAIEIVVKNALKEHLGKTPEIEDYVKCEKVTMTGVYDRWQLKYSGTPLGMIISELDYKQMNQRMNVRFDPKVTWDSK